MMKRVAIVEDNPDNRLLLCAMLEDRYDIVEFESGVDALKDLESAAPGVVLLDISLPGMDGLEVLTRLRADPALRPLPVIAITAHAMAGDRERFLTHGFDDYLSKPILDDRVLVELIESWFERSRAS
ncbi:MAG: response regulator [Acidobacteriota bacterium]